MLQGEPEATNISSDEEERCRTLHSAPSLCTPCSENFLETRILELTHSLQNQEVRISSLCQSKPDSSVVHLSLRV